MTWSMWLKFHKVFSVAGNSRFLQTAQLSPAAFAACTPPPTRWPTWVSQAWQSPQSAWSAQSWPCSSISSPASTVLSVKVSSSAFSVLFFPPLSRSAMQPPCLDSYKSRSIELCVTWNNPSMTSTTLSLDRIAKATHDGHTLCWAPAGRPPGQCLWMPWVIQKEGQMFQFWLAVFYPSKPPEKDFPLLWLLLPVCISAVLMAACSNMSASL